MTPFEYLQSQGYIPTGNVSADAIEVKDQNGQIGSIPKSSLGGDPRSTDYSKLVLNNPEQAVDERSKEIGISDLAKFGVGNSQGIAQYMAKKLGGSRVKINNQGDITVLDSDGVWRKTDKSFLGSLTDPRELSKDLIEAIPDIASGFATGAATGASALATGGLAGAGTALAVGGAAGLLKSNLGRLLGTYDASPGEQVRDAAIEGALSLGGYLVPIGKPVAEKGVKAAASRIVKSGEEGLANVAGMLEKGTDATFYEAKTALEHMDSVLPMAKRAWQSVGRKEGDAGVDNTLSAEAVQHVRSAAEAADQAIQSNYKTSLENIAKSIPNKKLDAQNFMQQVEEALPKGVFARGEEGGAFRFATDAEAAKLGGSGTVAQERGNLQQMLNRINALDQVGDLKGPAAANYLSKAERDLNQIYRQIYKSNSVSDQTKAQARDLNNAFKAGLTKWFDAAGKGKEYAAAKAPYLDYKDAINQVLDANHNQILSALGRDQGAEVQQLMPALQRVAKAGGAASQQSLENAIKANASRVVADWFDPFGWTPKQSLPGKARDVYDRLKGNPYAASRLLSQKKDALNKAFGVNPKYATQDPTVAQETWRQLANLKMLPAALGDNAIDLLKSPQELQQAINNAYTFHDQIQQGSAGLLQQSGAVR